jgi:hypothetical protein
VYRLLREFRVPTAPQALFSYRQRNRASRAMSILLLETREHSSKAYSWNSHWYTTCWQAMQGQGLKVQFCPGVLTGVRPLNRVDECLRRLGCSLRSEESAAVDASAWMSHFRWHFLLSHVAEHLSPRRESEASIIELCRLGTVSTSCSVMNSRSLESISPLCKAKSFG